MSACETVAVKNKDCPKGYMLINADEFDKEKHTKMSDAERAKADKAAEAK